MDKDHKRLPVAVVGAGAGGLPMAVALAEAGHKVVLLERGTEHSAQAFPTDRYDYELLPPPWRKPSVWEGPFPLQTASAVGGASVYFQGVSHLPPESVIRAWGLDPKAFARSASEVSDFLQLAGERQPAHPLNRVSSHLFASARKMGWKVRHAPVAILSRPHDGRPACNRCGLCVYGCRIGDKGSADRTWLPRFRRNADATLLANTEVQSLEVDPDGRARSLVANGPAGPFRLAVKAVVLSAGALETPRLLRHSRSEAFPGGLGNANVGRWLTGTLWHSMLLTLPHIEGRAHVGIPVDLLVEEFEREGILLSQGRNLAGIVGPISAARFFTSRYGSAGLRPWMRENFTKLAGIAGFAESAPQADDGLVGDGTRKRFRKPLRHGDRERLERIGSILHRWARAAGATLLSEYGSARYGLSGAMLRGACRIGAEPDSAAVAPDGRLYGHPNVVVNDASMIGPGLIADPSFPLQVLGVHNGRAFAERLKAA